MKSFRQFYNESKIDPIGEFQGGNDRFLKSFQNMMESCENWTLISSEGFSGVGVVDFWVGKWGEAGGAIAGVIGWDGDVSSLEELGYRKIVCGMDGTVKSNSLIVESAWVGFNYRGKGLGKSMYLAALDHFDKLASDTHVSEKMAKLYDSLTKVEGVKAILSDGTPYDREKWLGDEKLRLVLRKRKTITSE